MMKCRSCGYESETCTHECPGFQFKKPNKKQQIAEAERRFENWWRAEGSESLHTLSIRFTWEETRAYKSLLKEAWMNGAFVTRENN